VTLRHEQFRPATATGIVLIVGGLWLAARADPAPADTAISAAPALAAREGRPSTRATPTDRALLPTVDGDGSAADSVVVLG
jgi:hypothetical protein